MATAVQVLLGQLIITNNSNITNSINKSISGNSNSNWSINNFSNKFSNSNNFMTLLIKINNSRISTITMAIITTIVLRLVGTENSKRDRVRIPHRIPLPRRIRQQHPVARFLSLVVVVTW
jgi:hypothetical protein